MDEKDWHIITTLYEEKNITKAAGRLYISQPALSYRIQQMEKEFDSKIVSRGKKGVEFTVKGEFLVQYAQDMIDQLRKTKEQILNMDNTVKGTLRLAVSGLFARYELPSLLKEFLSIYPEVEVNLKTGWSSDIHQMLQKEESHLGIVRGDYSWKENKILLREEKICIASSKKIAFDELPYLPRVNYQTDHSLKNTIANWWQETYSVPPMISMEVDRLDTCKELVLNGLGYAILPEICIKNDEDLYIAPILLQENKYLLRNTWIFYRDATLELAQVKAFIDFLSD
ncbi:LysR family transcriptional regulator [Psychrobacillus lasiicapitis]|uniref:LysR family transcriptional regulator n=1 Tax=Psychrobacillus lasiicapitis TaxID=1636719 RepID=A0A544T2Z6_9BACI|nr:LysR family transcriptional regulator [Psychrobacillus lasiicapitis]TQR11813.1 LysR family transcriptional regulator [Psychrobacillus lasiicapitis]GGA19659.1 putative HTH-type transcriptional regulator YraN [Psychrobacillus lasiicapitis]